MKKCPDWAGSMVNNYRNQFKSTYGADTTLTDDQIFHITETVFVDESSAEEDKARVEQMKADQE